MEIEKSLGGVQSSDRVDGGTGSAMFGQLLTWMQESQSSKYIVATANDMGPLLAVSQGALLRRFDDIFFVDLPTEEEREAILKIHNKKYSSDIPKSWVPALENYTGAEIEKICKSSRYEGAEKALELTHTIYEQNKAVIDKMRNWAKRNARPANSPGKAKAAQTSSRKLITTKTASSSEKKSRRKVRAKKVN